ncbi:MAG TPA: MBL fold metallo-hydrolase RNA specificity domain-containing protein [Methanoregulaceae archaeon]|nr:MBL fold metallo-hydrolase RNA specificity domain-containing protein [Methanoregulaceae archaeon]
MVSLTVYDGAGGIGGNKIFLEDQRNGVFLDFGMNFSKNSKYYEEFLKARSSRGIHDLLRLNFIPKLNIYRSDLIPTDVSVDKFPSLNICAALISHAHMDHCGYMGLLREDIPVIGSCTSLALMKAMQDTQNQVFGSDVTYCTFKSKFSEEGFVLESKRDAPYVGRTLYSTTEPCAGLVDFLNMRPIAPSSKKKFNPPPIQCLSCGTIPFEISAYPVDHSIYGATAFILEGTKNIAYTGDFRVHGKHAEQTREFANRARGVDILITEGTRAGREDAENAGSETCPTNSVSEQTVYDTCRAVVDESSSLVVADFSARNIERLEMFLDIAQKSGRSLVATAKDAYILQTLNRVEPVGRLEEVLVYDALKAENKSAWEDLVVASGGRLIGHREISCDPEQYVVCFSFFDMNHLLDISPEGGDYIYSSCEAFSEEMVIDFQRLWEWLLYFKMRVHGLEMVKENNQLKPRTVKGFHASGHASREDLEEIITQIDPGVVIPVHTTGHQWFSKTFDTVQIVREGERLEL